MTDRLCKILTIDNDAQAQALHEELNRLEIPHILRTYHDSAYDGLFQQSMGWGHIEAEPDYKDAICNAFDELEQRASSEETEP